MAAEAGLASLVQGGMAIVTGRALLMAGESVGASGLLVAVRATLDSCFVGLMALLAVGVGRPPPLDAARRAGVATSARCREPRTRRCRVGLMAEPTLMPHLPDLLSLLQVTVTAGLGGLRRVRRVAPVAAAVRGGVPDVDAGCVGLVARAAVRSSLGGAMDSVTTRAIAVLAAARFDVCVTGAARRELGFRGLVRLMASLATLRVVTELHGIMAGRAHGESGLELMLPMAREALAMLARGSDSHPLPLRIVTVPAARLGRSCRVRLVAVAAGRVRRGLGGGASGGPLRHRIVALGTCFRPSRVLVRPMAGRAVLVPMPSLVSVALGAGSRGGRTRVRLMAAEAVRVLLGIPGCQRGGLLGVAAAAFLTAGEHTMVSVAVRAALMNRTERLLLTRGLFLVAPAAESRELPARSMRGVAARALLVDATLLDVLALPRRASMALATLVRGGAFARGERVGIVTESTGAQCSMDEIGRDRRAIIAQEGVGVLVMATRTVRVEGLRSCPTSTHGVAARARWGGADLARVRRCFLVAVDADGG